jgi:hypothetical protein
MISFIHYGGPQMASYRYRVQIPAKSLGAQINQYPADILIFSKPQPGEVGLARRAQADGYKVVADFCDDHFECDHYQEMALLADLVVCPTQTLADLIECCFPACDFIRVVPDTYEFQEFAPHCNGTNLLWFGHNVNAESLRGMDHGYPMRVVSNLPGAIPWSLETLCDELLRADIVLMPATSKYKSPNRTLEAVRMGCFVVAEPHPAINDFPIWIGDIKEGIAWASQNPQKANQMIRQAQAFVREKYSPAIQADAWRTALATLN